MRQVRNIVIWSVLGLVILACAIVVLGATTNDRGEPLVENPGGLLASMFGSVAVLGAGVFGFLTKLEKSTEVVRENTQAAREQLENDHISNPNKVSNIRDDLDKKATTEDLNKMHQQLIASVERLGNRMDQSFVLLDQRVQGSASDIRGIRTDIGRVHRKQDAFERRMDAVEKSTLHVAETTDTISQIITPTED